MFILITIFFQFLVYFYFLSLFFSIFFTTMSSVFISFIFKSSISIFISTSSVFNLFITMSSICNSFISIRMQFQLLCMSKMYRCVYDLQLLIIKVYAHMHPRSIFSSFIDIFYINTHFNTTLLSRPKYMCFEWDW